MARTPNQSTNNTTLAISPEDRIKMLGIIARHQLDTGEKLTLKKLVSLLVDCYVGRR